MGAIPVLCKGTDIAATSRSRADMATESRTLVCVVFRPPAKGTPPQLVASVALAIGGAPSFYLFSSRLFGAVLETADDAVGNPVTFMQARIHGA